MLGARSHRPRNPKVSLLKITPDDVFFTFVSPFCYPELCCLGILAPQGKHFHQRANCVSEGHPWTIWGISGGPRCGQAERVVTSLMTVAGSRRDKPLHWGPRKCVSRTWGPRWRTSNWLHVLTQQAGWDARFMETPSPKQSTEWLRGSVPIPFARAQKWACTLLIPPPPPHTA